MHFNFNFWVSQTIRFNTIKLFFKKVLISLRYQHKTCSISVSGCSPPLKKIVHSILTPSMIHLIFMLHRPPQLANQFKIHPPPVDDISKIFHRRYEVYIEKPNLPSSQVNTSVEPLNVVSFKHISLLGNVTLKYHIETFNYH